MIGALLAVLTVLQTTPTGVPPSRATAAEVVSIRRVFSEEVVAVLWLHADRDGRLEMEGVEALAIPFRITRHARPTGDGVWVQLLSGQLKPLAAYRTTVPAPGSTCALEVPLVRGAWWVLLTEHHGDTVRILARFKVAEDLAEIHARWGK